MATEKYPGIAGFIIFLLLTINSSYAQQPPPNATKPTQQQLDKLLRGNSSKGVWADRSYIQHFDASGATEYREEGGRTTNGTWRINEDGHYCSIWPPFPRETCYELLVDNNVLYWKWENAYYLSTVIPGNIFKQQ